ncbi:MAG TPA: glycosyltransferase family 2 protein [Jiangellales bacterium]|nr:glycosyltransferase family 2 protein [Jiangellales bacterium]
MSRPLLTVGLPVRNGEPFLSRALDAVLRQDVDGLEVVVSDNASTDRTEDICRQAARQDRRVSYVRHPANIGAVPNYRFVLAAAQGDLFKWAAADDEISPGFLPAAVGVLADEPDAVLAQGECVDVDVDGRLLRRHPRLATDGPDPVRRFHALMGRHECLQQYGVVRTRVLRAQRPYPAHPEGDRVVLAALALRGRLVHVGSVEFRRRVHADQSLHAVRRSADRVAWLDPARTGDVPLPAWELARDLLRVVHDASLTPRQRAACYLSMRTWLATGNAEKMARNLVRAGLDLLAARRTGVAAGGAT